MEGVREAAGAGPCQTLRPWLGHKRSPAGFHGQRGPGAAQILGPAGWAGEGVGGQLTRTRRILYTSSDRKPWCALGSASASSRVDVEKARSLRSRPKS